MKNSYRITFSAACAAIATVIMLVSYFPYLTYAVPAAAGIITFIPLAEINKKYAFFVYLVTSVMVFISAEKEAMLMYVCFFGYYPILKSVFEKIRLTVLGYILKFLVFNASIFLVYFVFASFFGIEPEEYGYLGKFALPVLIVAANVVFVIYDIFITRLAALYFSRFHKIISKFTKNKL